MLTPLTELDAVNEMLMSIGQAPVSSLSVPGDVAIARSLLTPVVRYVQLYGFEFNTDEDYTLTPDVDGLIHVPEGVLRLDPMDPRQRLTPRTHPTSGRCLWDLANRTWTMSAPVDCRIVWAYAFEDLPESAKNYITVAACRRFQAKMIGSRELDLYEEADEQRAWNLLIRDERANRDTNSFRKSKSLQSALNRTGRGYPWTGGEVTG